MTEIDSRAWTEGIPKSEVGTASGPFRDPMRPVVYRGDTQELLTLLLHVSTLAILTLTLYRFWGKTRVREYIWSNTHLFGELLRYTGVPGELAIGFGAVIALLAPLFFVLHLTADEGHLVTLISGLAVYSVVCFGRYTAHRYRLSRTRWQNACGALDGSPMAYAFMCVAQYLFMMVTLGLALPARDWVLYRMLVDNISLGDQKFSAVGTPHGLFKVWFPCWLLFVPTLGLSLVYYKSREIPAFIGATTFAGRRLRVEANFREMLSVYWPYWGIAPVYILFDLLLNIIGVVPDDGGLGAEILSYGISVLLAVAIWTWARVLVQHNLVRFLAWRLEIEGPREAITIQPDHHRSPRFGEGVVGALEVGGL